MKTISEALAEVTAEWCEEDGIQPEDINYGDCEAFAEEIAKLVSGAVVLWDHEAAELEKRGVDGFWCVHCFVSYEGKYYDSECHHGVENWQQLPTFVRENSLRRAMCRNLEA